MVTRAAGERAVAGRIEDDSEGSPRSARAAAGGRRAWFGIGFRVCFRAPFVGEPGAPLARAEGGRWVQARSRLRVSVVFVGTAARPVKAMQARFNELGAAAVHGRTLAVDGVVGACTLRALTYFIALLQKNEWPGP